MTSIVVKNDRNRNRGDSHPVKVRSRRSLGIHPSETSDRNFLMRNVVLVSDDEGPSCMVTNGLATAEKIVCIDHP